MTPPPLVNAVVIRSALGGRTPSGCHPSASVSKILKYSSPLGRVAAAGKSGLESVSEQGTTAGWFRERWGLRATCRSDRRLSLVHQTVDSDPARRNHRYEGMSVRPIAKDYRCRVAAQKARNAFREKFRYFGTATSSYRKARAFLGDRLFILPSRRFSPTSVA